MGFGDKLKGLRDQAQQAVAENKEKIQSAVETVGVAANEKTGGKYANKIMKVGEKVTASVEKVAAPGSDDAAAQAPETAEAPAAEATFAAGFPEAPAATFGDAPAPAFADAPAPAFADAPAPAFADAPASPAPEATPVAEPAAPTGGIPDFE